MPRDTASDVDPIRYSAAPMNPPTTLRVILIASCVLASACDSPGPKRIDDTTSSMRETKTSVDRGNEQVTTVMTAATAVETAQDRKRAFEQFSKACDRLEGDAKDVQSSWDKLKTRTADYVKAWEADAAKLSSVDSKQVASARREAFTARVATIQADLDAAKASYTDLKAKLSDIRIMLANDLTAEGVASVKPAIEAAQKVAVQLKENVAKLSQALDAEITRSSTAAPPAAK